jgi:hypothetical protein
MGDLRGVGYRVALRLAAIGIGCLIALGALELVLRSLPVASGLHAERVNAENPVFHFATSRAFVWSLDWNFSVVNEGWSNNEGFINDQDYDASRTDPLLALIGDSYVEAAMVPFESTLHGRLATTVGSRGRVYSFAASGAPLSQYLVWAEYARRRFRPLGMVFVVIGNDFDESLAKYKTGPGFHHFVEDSDGSLRPRLYEYSPTSFRKVIRRSALARYLVFNLHADVKLLAFLNRLKGGMSAEAPTVEGNSEQTQATQEPRFVGNTSAVADGARVKDSLRAVDAFLEALPGHSGLPPAQIAFIVDGVRPQLYGGRAKLDSVSDSHFSIVRGEFMARAQLRGYEVIDMNEAFMVAYRQRGQRFEFANDSHWNGEGHAVAASMVKKSAVYSAVFDE